MHRKCVNVKYSYHAACLVNTQFIYTKCALLNWSSIKQNRLATLYLPRTQTLYSWFMKRLIIIQ